MIARLSPRPPNCEKPAHDTSARGGEPSGRPFDRKISFISNDSFPSLRIDNKTIDELVQCVPDPRAPGRNPMPGHLECMCNTPLLTADEERDLFRAMNFLKYRADLLQSSLHPSRPSRRKLQQIREALAMALQVRNRIVNSNVRLIVSIVKKFADSDCSFDDLLSEGISCLINAVEKFDFARGFRFSTYATSAVRRDLFRLVQRQHRDRSRYATGTSEILELSWAAPENPNRSERVMTEVAARVGQFIETLDDRERFIVRARYGFIDLGEKPTFQRLGRELGVSKERVRQLEIRAIGKLQRLALDAKLDAIA